MCWVSYHSRLRSQRDGKGDACLKVTIECGEKRACVRVLKGNKSSALNPIGDQLFSSHRKGRSDRSWFIRMILNIALAEVLWSDFTHFRASLWTWTALSLSLSHTHTPHFLISWVHAACWRWRDDAKGPEVMGTYPLRWVMAIGS